MKSAKHKYYNHKSRANRRNIEFNMTFEEWINWWGDDFEKRGVTNGCLQMCRYNDEGPYELGNIYKATREQNLKDAYKTESGNERKEHMRNRMSGAGNPAYGKPAPNRGISHTEETKRKIGAANKGRTISDEQKTKISAAQKGKTVSDETKAKMSAWQKGKPKSEETRARLSAAKKSYYAKKKLLD